VSDYADPKILAFTALPPGWINVYQNEDGTYFTRPCAGVMLRDIAMDSDDDAERDRFVEFTEECEGWLTGVCDNYRYVMSTTQEEWEGQYRSGHAYTGQSLAFYKKSVGKV
jgi:hypothetical protein